MIYLISYEINEQQFDYSELKDAIKSYGDYQHPMETLWFVKVTGLVHNADSIAEKLRSYFHSTHDHIFVMEVSDGVDRQGWLPKVFWKWLKQ